MTWGDTALREVRYPSGNRGEQLSLFRKSARGGLVRSRQSHVTRGEEVEGQLYPRGAAVDWHCPLAMKFPLQALEVPLDGFKEPYPLDDGGVGLGEA